MPKHTSYFSLSHYSKLFLGFLATSSTGVFASQQKTSISWDEQPVDVSKTGEFVPNQLTYPDIFSESITSQKPTRSLTSHNCQRTGTCQLSELTDGMKGFMLEGEASHDWAGISLSSAGDINGDGISDLLVGAYRASPGGMSRAGKTYVVFGSNNMSAAWPNGSVPFSRMIDGERGFVLEGEVSIDNSGRSVSSAGDINGDGIGDLLVGAPYASPDGRSLAGKTYVVFGSNEIGAWGNGSVLLGRMNDGVRGFVLEGEVRRDYSGISVSSAGDINGDGISDLLVGAHYADPAGRSDAGKTYVVFGSKNAGTWNNGTLPFSSLIDGACGFVLEGEVAGDNSGYSVSGAGDINSDGISDLLVGARYAGPGGKNVAGKTYVVFGSNATSAWGSGTVPLSSMIDGVRGFVLEGEAEGDKSGASVGPAGDINNDGIDDLLVGAYLADPDGRNDAGKTYVVFGSNKIGAWGNGSIPLSSMIDGVRGFVLEGETGDKSGTSVSGAGDINGDGINDMLVGACKADPGGKRRPGKIYVVFGRSSATAWSSGALRLSEVMNGKCGYMLEGELIGDYSGYSVNSAGDINGDGLSDILVGAPYTSGPYPVDRIDTGKTYAVFGSSFSLAINCNPSISSSPSLSNTPSDTYSAGPPSSFNAILFLTIGSLGLGILGLYLGLVYQSRKRIDTAIRSHKVGLLENSEHYQKNTLRPIAKAVLQRLNVRGCGVQSLKKSQDYLSAINAIINALILQEVETDLSKLTKVQRQRLLAKITDAAYIELIGNRSCGSSAWCASFFKADVTPGQMQDAAESIVLNVKQAMSSEHFTHSSAVQMGMFQHSQHMILHHAITSGKNSAEISALITGDPDSLHQKNEHGKLPVEVAAEAGLLDIVELLFAKGSPGDQVETIQQALGAQRAVEHKSLNPLTSF